MHGQMIIIITILALVNFSCAFYSGFIKSMDGLSNGISENVTVLSNVSINSVCPSEHKKCLWRCCPSGKNIVARKKCKPSNLSFSNITVYDSYFKSNSKSIEEVFELIPGILSDKLFRKNALPYSFLYVTYLLEDGNLYLEMPNAYQRWIKIETNHFCVDMLNTGPVFIAEMKRELRETYDVVNLKYALGVTVGFLLLTILPYVVLPQIRDINGALLIIFLTFFILHMAIIIKTLCFEPLTATGFLVTSILYYFCFVSSICWTNVIFYRILSSNTTKNWTKLHLLMYCLYAVGLPALLSAVVTVTETTDMTDMPWIITPKIIEFGLCFFDGKESLFYLYIPLGMLLLFDWLVCIVIVVKFCKKSRSFRIIKIQNIGRVLESPTARSSQYVKLLVLLTMYFIVNILTIIYPNYDKGSDVCFFFTLFIGPVIFITFVIDRSILTMAKQFLAKLRTKRGSAKSMECHDWKYNECR